MIVKRFLFPGLLLVLWLLIIGCKTTISQKAVNLNPLDMLVGVWEGYYTGGNQGETGLTLTIYKEGEEYMAISHFYNLPGRSNTREGRFYMKVSYDPSTGKFFLKAHEWILRPGSYIWGDLEGELTGNEFKGSVVFNNRATGTSFTVTRK